MVRKQDHQRKYSQMFGRQKLQRATLERGQNARLPVTGGSRRSALQLTALFGYLCSCWTLVHNLHEAVAGGGSGRLAPAAQCSVF